ncbi:MAG: AAA family ATPase [Treponema sp.]
MKVVDKNKLKLDEAMFDISEEQIIKLKKMENNDDIIGQNRAVEALKIGIKIKGEGYNIFVIGGTGTGRGTAISSMLSNYHPKDIELQDIAYAFNFKNTTEPRLLYFPKGRAIEFRKELQKSIKTIKSRLEALLIDGEMFYESHRLREKRELEEVETIALFEQKVKDEGFKIIKQKEGGTSQTLFPLINGKPVSFLRLQKMVLKGKVSKEKFQELKSKYHPLLKETHNILSHLNDVEKKTEEEIKNKQSQCAKPIIKEELKKIFSLIKKYASLCYTEKQKNDNKRLLRFGREIERDLYKKIKTICLPFKNKRMLKNFIGRYDINIVYKNTKNKTYVIDEMLTSFSDIFGTIEIDPEVVRDYKNAHLKIKEGAIHKALNGYLILRLDALARDEDAWEYLKSILLSGKIKMQSQSRSSHSSLVIQPEAIPMLPKIIVIGDEESYSFLSEAEPDFYKLFKVCATFDSTMIRNDENTSKFISLVSSLCKKQELLPLKDSAYKALILFSSRLSECQKMLSTQFTKIADCLTLANYLAKEEGLKYITEKEIKKAIEKKHYFSSMIEEKFQDMLRIGDLIIEVKDKTIARINGLAVEEDSLHSFGVPIAITAQVSCGMGGIINIEKEVGLSGEIFDKAHLIITSLLRRKFLKHYPLCISASICSEQSYSYIDGDSASVAHFLALVSAIAEIPMRQDIAVTGSLNQLGEVQAVGGVTEKIIGFFNTCKILGFTGEGGVVIPESNKINLFLPDEILQAIKEKRFNIWTIKNIDEGIELLSDMKKTEYTPLIEEKLISFAKTIIEMNAK